MFLIRAETIQVWVLIKQGDVLTTFTPPSIGFQNEIYQIPPPLYPK